MKQHYPHTAQGNREYVRDLAREKLSAAERAQIHWEACQIVKLRQEIEEWEKESGSSS